jgi:SAM-dependent methyltransferase
MDLTQHNIEIQQNLNFWQKKPLLQEIYLAFYQLIAAEIDHRVEGKIVELGSGIGNIKMVVPEAICTDLFKNPWIDQKENAYCLSFDDRSISNLILFDVFHHLEFPGTALKEFNRVLKPSGRIIIFDPYISLAGLFIYGLLHHEPIGILKRINWLAPENFDAWNSKYYAAQGNATRIFFSKKYSNQLQDFELKTRKVIPALAYIASGGYSKPQVLPDKAFNYIRGIECKLKYLSWLFGTRTLITIAKADK